MSQIVLDDDIDLDDVVPGLTRWITWTRLQSLRPGQRILDDRVPEILLTLRRPTFVTIDSDLCRREFCHSGYCILWFNLRTEEQHELPNLLRRLFRLPEFASRAARMGKVARVLKQSVTYWDAG